MISSFEFRKKLGAYYGKKISIIGTIKDKVVRKHGGTRYLLIDIIKDNEYLCNHIWFISEKNFNIFDKIKITGVVSRYETTRIKNGISYKVFNYNIKRNSKTKVELIESKDNNIFLKYVGVRKLARLDYLIKKIKIEFKDFIETFSITFKSNINTISVFSMGDYLFSIKVKNVSLLEESDFSFEDKETELEFKQGIVDILNFIKNNRRYK